MVILLAILVVYLALRLPALTLLPVFCDEGIYIHWAQKILQNFRLDGFIPLTDGKTPLFMWVAAPFQAIFSDPLFAGRIVSVLSGLATVAGVMVLGKKYFNPRVGLIAAIFVSVIPFIVFFDRMALADSMLAAFSIWSLILGLNLADKFSLKNIILLGIVLGGGILAKTPGLFSFITLPLVILTIKFKKEGVREVFKKIVGLFVSLGIGWGFYNLLRLSKYFTSLSSRNLDYYFPFSRLLVTPLDPFTGHTHDLVDWLPKLLTWPVLALIGVAVILIVFKRNLVSIAIFLWGLLPLIALMLLLKTFTARYILFSIVPIIFLGAWALDYLYSLLPIKKKVIPLVIVTILLLIPAFSFDYYLLTDPQKAPLPREERRGYLEDWTAGYGLKEIAGFLENKSIDGEILVVTEGSFGTLPDGLQIYLGDNSNISIWYSTSVLTPEVYDMVAFKPTYFVINKSRLTHNPGLKLIAEYPRAKGPEIPQDALLLYEVTR
jgi:4-amino-4-deoxy-L-arabinose transferase-like glycosyltransferase